MSILRANQWQNFNGIQYDTVIQCQTIITNNRSTWSSPVSSQTIVTPLTIAITPKRSNSKIVVHWMINGELHQDNVFRIFRNGVEAPNGRNAEAPSSRWSGYSAAFYDQNEDSTPSSWNILYMDTPNSAAAQSYQIAVGSSSGAAYTFALNRTLGATASDNREIMVSSAVAWEVYQ